MADHTLTIVVNRTMETGKWVAEVVVDKAHRHTTLVFSQREEKFSPLRWLKDRFQHRQSATALAKKYLQALNFYPDQSFGARPGVTHIRKAVTQSAIDRKFSLASRTLHANNSATGPTSAPFASSTSDFSRIKVSIHDSVEYTRARTAAISAILDEVAAVDKAMSQGSREYYYEPLLKLAFDIANEAADSAPESELRSALALLNDFSKKLTAPDKPESTSMPLIEDMRSRVDRLLCPAAEKPLQPAEVPLSAPAVYGKRPVRPAGLDATKNKTPGP